MEIGRLNYGVIYLIEGLRGLTHTD